MQVLPAIAMSTALLGVFATPSARAEPLPVQHFLPLSVAIEAATAALDHCTKDGHHVSIEVMNHNAMVMVTYHHELATIHSAYSAHAKAYTVLSYSYSSGETTSAAIANRLGKLPADLARPCRCSCSTSIASRPLTTPTGIKGEIPCCGQPPG